MDKKKTRKKTEEYISGGHIYRRRGRMLFPAKGGKKNTGDDNYYRQLEQRRMNPYHHIQKIVSLSEIYEKEQVQMAIEDAFSFSAFSCEYIANILEQRARPYKEPGALHLTRNSDLLELSIDQQDLSIYNKIIEGDENE